MIYLAELRKKHNLSQAELAKKLNVTQGAVSQWEKGIVCPSISKIQMIAEKFGCKVDDLLSKQE